MRSLVALVLAASAARLASAFTIPSVARVGRRPVVSKVGRSVLSMSADEFTVAILGDLHIDPNKMEDYVTGRSQFMPILEEAKKSCGDESVSLVSLGDLGESKPVDDPDELYAGTTRCHEKAAEFLGSFGVPYDVVGGNHDLEGIDEFSTDEANLEAYLRIHGKETAQFSRLIAEKTLLVGLGSTVFRTAKYTSHEVTVDDEQLAWFEELVKAHPAADGWKLFVFTHAPPMGCGLRVLQENHVVNGCCWLNHSGGESTRKFIQLVREHRCIKAWFSGHFHLGQDYQDSITFPTPEANRGSCVFAQTSVMRGSGCSRDKRQQSRMIRGNKDGFEIFTVNHLRDGEERLDATITYSNCNEEVGVYAHDSEDYDHESFFQVYSPQDDDGCFVDYSDDEEGVLQCVNDCQDDTTCWWKLACGRVLGVNQGMLVEYDPSTLAPLGLVVGFDELQGRKVAVIESGLEGCAVVSDEIGMEGTDCAEAEAGEQAVVLYDDSGKVTVVQPNEDGSYWRKIVRNKMIRMKEKRRENAAKAFAKELIEDGAIAAPADDLNVVSSWGPYTSTVGTAKATGVPGMTSPAKV